MKRNNCVKLFKIIFRTIRTLITKKCNKYDSWRKQLHFIYLFYFYFWSSWNASDYLNGTPNTDPPQQKNEHKLMHHIDLRKDLQDFNTIKFVNKRWVVRVCARSYCCLHWRLHAIEIVNINVWCMQIRQVIPKRWSNNIVLYMWCLYSLRKPTKFFCFYI